MNFHNSKIASQCLGLIKSGWGKFLDFRDPATEGGEGKQGFGAGWSWGTGFDRPFFKEPNYQSDPHRCPLVPFRYENLKVY